MKDIRVTEEHEKKLLEMARKLFPKYTILPWNLQGKRAYDKGYIKYWKESDKGASFMHWFEFCMIHLATKLAKKGHNALSLNHYSNLIQYKIHPIDYLYTEFKKIKHE